jgi:hypothetical protein
MTMPLQAFWCCNPGESPNWRTLHLDENCPSLQGHCIGRATVVEGYRSCTESRQQCLAGDVVYDADGSTVGHVCKMCRRREEQAYEIRHGCLETRRASRVGRRS